MSEYPPGKKKDEKEDKEPASSAPKTLMGAALEKALEENGHWKPEKSTKSHKGHRKKKRGHRGAETSGAHENASGFDPDKAVLAARAEYANLEALIKSHRTTPEDFATIQRRAIRVRNEVERLSEQFWDEKEEEKKKDLAHLILERQIELSTEIRAEVNAEIEKIASKESPLETTRKLDKAITYALQRSLATTSEEILNQAPSIQARLAVAGASGNLAAIEKAITEARAFLKKNFPGVEEQYDQVHAQEIKEAREASLSKSIKETAAANTQGGQEEQPKGIDLGESRREIEAKAAAENKPEDNLVIGKSLEQLRTTEEGMLKAGQAGETEVAKNERRREELLQFFGITADEKSKLLNPEYEPKAIEFINKLPLEDQILYSKQYKLLVDEAKRDKNVAEAIASTKVETKTPESGSVSRAALGKAEEDIRESDETLRKMDAFGAMRNTETSGEKTDDELMREFKDAYAEQGVTAVERPTPRESRSILGKLIDGYKKTLEGAKGMAEGASERFVKSKNYLNERAKAIDANMEMSGLEKTARYIGEKYDKLSFIHKLGVGVALGIGTAIGSAVSLPLALFGLSGLVIQRAAGAASMFLKIEKDLQEKKVAESFQFIGLKERAAIDAALYTAVMGTAINEIVEAVPKFFRGEWLARVLDHQPAVGTKEMAAIAQAKMEMPTAASPTLEVSSVPTNEMSSAMPETSVAAPEASATYGYEYGDAAAPPEVAPIAGQTDPGYITSEAVAPAAETEGLSIEVKATAGKGYEYMMKRVWEQLQDLKEQGLDPSKYDKGTDIRQLLDANPKDIDALVHNLASDKAHGFFNPDGTSIRIDMDARMTIGSDGQLHLIDPVHGDMTRAVEGMRTTPVYPAQVLTAQPTIEVPAQGLGEEAPLPYPGVPIEQPPVPVEGRIPTPVTPPAAEAAAWQGSDGQVWRDSSGNPIQSESFVGQPTPAPEVSAPLEAVTPTAEAPATSLPTEGVPAQEAIPAVTSEQATASAQPEVSGVGTPEAQTFFTKIDNIQINPEAPAIYEAQTPSGETYLAAYGGSDDARFKFIQEYLARPENQGKSIRFAHEVPSIFGSQVRVDEIGASANEGQTSWLLNFFNKPISPPSPEMFLKKLSK